MLPLTNFFNKKVVMQKLTDSGNYEVVYINPHVFDNEELSPLTNEIPHLSIYELLNRNLRMDWSRELIGQTKVDFENRNSKKTVGGVQAKDTYHVRDITYTSTDEMQGTIEKTAYDKEGNPYTYTTTETVPSGSILVSSLEKPNISVNGALETEIDYLMHEHARYLTKLYPSDVNSLITLTKAERQSYFNEAEHMIHSYFDTEQIASNSDTESDLTINEIDSKGDSRIINYSGLTDLYLQNRFLTGITSVRQYTGVSYQETSLIRLLNASVFTGFNIYQEPIGLREIFSKNSQTVSTSTILDYYSFYSDDSIQRVASTELSGKILHDSLQDFLIQDSEVLSIKYNFSKFSSYYKINNFNDISEYIRSFFLTNDEGDFNINKTFRLATSSGKIKAGAGLANLMQASVFSNIKLTKDEGNPYIFLFTPTSTESSVKFVPYTINGVNLEELEDLQNSLFSNSTTIANIKDSFIIKTGELEYNSNFLLSIGNIILSELTNIIYKNSSDEANSNGNNFELLVNSIIGNASENLQLLVLVKQDGKLVLSGLLNKAAIRNINNLNVYHKQYTYEDYVNDYSAENLLSYINYYDLLQKSCFDIREQITTTFIPLNLSTDTDLSKDIYIYNDKDYNDNRLIILKATSEGDYNVTVTYDSISTLGDPIVATATGLLTNGSLKMDKSNVTYRLLPDSIECSFKKTDKYCIIDGIKYILPTKENKYFVTKDDGFRVGRKITNKKFFDYKYIQKGNKLSDLKLRVNGVIINIASSFESEYGYKDTSKNTDFVYKELTKINTVELDINWLNNYWNLINYNTTPTIATFVNSTKNEKGEVVNSYVYSTQLVNNAVWYNDKDYELTKQSFGQVFFPVNKTDLFTLQTYDCYFYSDDILRLTKDIQDIVHEYGRISAIIIDNEKNRFAVTLKEAHVENEYCFVKLTNKVSGLSSEENPKGLLVIDLHKSISNTNIIANNTKIRRTLSNKQTFRLDEQYFYYKYTWEKLTQEHLNYVFDNINSEYVDELYNSSSTISQVTDIPKMLIQSGNLILTDQLNEKTINLIQDLIGENKSLYVDSIFKSIVFVPLSLHNLVYNEQYNSLSYLLQNDLVSSLSFYKEPSWEIYSDLKNFNDKIDSNDTISVDIISDIYSRRRIIWGNVVWDANDVNRTISVYRTIWSSYFANFEIYLSNDIIPDESVLLTLSNSSNLRDLSFNLLNYNYSANNSDITNNWIFVASLDQKNIIKNVKMLDLYTDTETDEYTKNLFTRNSNSNNLLIVKSNYLTANRLDKTSDSLRLVTCSTDIDILDFSKIEEINVIQNNSAQLIFDEINSDFKLKINSTDNIGNYVVGTKYKVMLLYNMIHLNYNDDNTNVGGSGLFNELSSNDTSLSMLLDMLLYQFYTKTIIGYETVSTTGNLNIYDFLNDHTNWDSNYINYYIPQLYDGDKNLNWESYEKAKNYKDKTIDFKDVLDYACSLPYIPSIGILEKNSNLKIYCYRFSKVNDSYTIIKNIITKPISGDLVYSLMPNLYKSFRVQPSLLNLYSNVFSLNQFLLPTSFKGQFTNLEIIPDYTTLATPDVSDKDLIIKNLKEIQDIYLKNINDHLVTTLANSVLTIDDKEFPIEPFYKYFKEYKEVSADFYQIEDNTDEEILPCSILFDKELDLENEGYLYIFDIKATARRTSYLPERETQIVERGYTLNNAHILGIREVDNTKQLLLQDSNNSNIKPLEASIEDITPLDATENEQLINDTNLKIGLNWEDPKVDIGYTFYKRSFVMESTISGVDPTLIQLSDDDKININLKDHIQEGDNVQIYLLNPNNAATEKTNATLVAPNGTYDSTYKIIYNDLYKDNGKNFQNIILGGSTSLVYININLDEGTTTVHSPSRISNVEINPFIYSDKIYAYSSNTKTLFDIGEVSEFIQTNNLEVKDSGALNYEGIEDLELYNSVENDLLSSHSIWYNTSLQDTSNLPKDEETENESSDAILSLTNPPIQIINNIPLSATVSLQIDEVDRLRRSEEDIGSYWVKDPAELEYFDAYDVSDSEVYITDSYIESLSQKQLNNFIKNRLVDLLGEGNTTLTIDNNTNSRSEVIANNLLNTLYGISSGTITINDLSNVKLPTSSEIDIPVYQDNIHGVKYRKIKYINNSTSNTLDSANIDDLQSFAKLIRQGSSIVRINNNITSWAKTDNNIVLWDQTSNTLQILDGRGRFKKGIAIKELGYDWQVTRENECNAYEIPNPLYFRIPTITSFVRAVNNSIKHTINGKEYGIYEIFDKGGPLYMPTLFASYNSSMLGNYSHLENVINVLRDETKYNEWRDYCKKQDLASNDIYPFVSFKQNKEEINFSNIRIALNKIMGKDEESKEVGAIQSLIQSNTDNPSLVKGIPFGTQEDPLQVAAVTEGQLIGYKSLITQSNIELTDEYIHLYGFVEFPILDENAAGTILANYKAKLQSDLTNISDNEDIIENLVNSLKSSIISSYSFLTSSATYPTTTTKIPFKYTISLSDYNITNTKIARQVDASIPNIYTMIAYSDSNLKAYTEKDNFDVSSSLSQFITLDNDQITLANIQDLNTVLLFDSIKNIGTINKQTLPTFNSNGSISFELSPTIIAANGNSIYYSSVFKLNEGSFKIKEDILNLKEGQSSKALIVVQDYDHDNFQLGYGNVTDISLLEPSSTLFVVDNYNSADFASYDNKWGSANTVVTEETTSVFNLYPTWEQIDENQRNYFYKTDSNNNITYLQNDYDRYILRISGELYDENGIDLGNNLIKAGNTVAGENISDTLDSNYILEKSYETITSLMNLQKVPALANHPRDVINTYPYKTFEIPISSGNIKIKDNYVLVNVESNGDLSNLYKGHLTNSYNTYNKSQLNTLITSQSYTPFTNEEAYIKAPQYFDTNKKLLDTSILNTEGVIATETKNDTTDILSISLRGTVGNNNGLITLSKNYSEGLIQGDWYIVNQNASITDLDLKIINRTINYPRFISISNYDSKFSTENFKLYTSSNEMYIPNRGYGQAIIGDYYTPDNIPFADDTFYDSNGKTINENGETFVLVDGYGNKILNEEGNEIFIPKMLYRSFAQADRALSRDLSTTETISGINTEALINLKNFTIENNSINLTKKSQLSLLNLITNLNTTEDNTNEAVITNIYQLFINNLKIACKVSYSKWPYDLTNNNVFQESVDLQKSLGYTRFYKNLEVPVNYKYLQEDKTYKLIINGGSPDYERISCDENGKVIYMDTSGNIVNYETINEPIPSLRLKKDQRFFDRVNATTINSIYNSFQFSKYYLKSEYITKRISCATSQNISSIFIVSKPQYQSKLTIDDYTLTVDWVLKSNNLKITYDKNNSMYNFIYLKNKNNEVIGKVFLKNGITSDNLIVFSLEN